MDYSNLDDSILMRLIVHARTEALSELYNRYFRQVFGLALTAIKDRALAEEITQDVFLRVWAHAKTYQENRAKVSVWLMGITRNRAIDILRRRGAHPEEQIITLEHLRPSKRESHDTPQQSLELTLQRERIQAAVAQLPGEQQHVIALMYFRGYAQQEIADLLKISIDTIKTRIRLAMLKLRKLLQDEDLVKSKIG